MRTLRVALLVLASIASTHAKTGVCPTLESRPSASSQPAEPQFFDEPQFVVAGVTDNTYRGGHGADAVLRSAETLAKATASLSGRTPQPTDDPHHTLAEADEHSGHSLQAVQEFQRAAELNPSDSNLFDWATELLAHRASRPAAEVFAKGVQLFPQSVRMMLGLATAWYSAGCYEQAAQYFFKAADLAPGDPTPYLFLSKVQRPEITESSGYVDRLARFLKLRPDNALANYYYAVAIWNHSPNLEDSKTPHKAQDLLKKAIRLDPHLGPAYLQLGVIYAGERHVPEAILAYRNALVATPDLEEAHYRLSEAYRLTGDLAKAQQELATYNQLSKDSAQEIERERRNLQQFVVNMRGQNPPQTQQPQ